MDTPAIPSPRTKAERKQVWIRVDLMDAINALRGTTPIQYKVDELLESALRQRRVLPSASAQQS